MIPFLNKVKSVWDRHITGTKQFLVMKKRQLLQHTLRTLHRQNFPDVINKEQEVRLALLQSQDSLARNIGNLSLAAQVQDLRKELVYWTKAALAYIAQKAKVDWIQFGDHNTTFFHVVMRKKHYRSKIFFVKGQEGCTLTSSLEITAHFQHYYSDLLGVREVRIGEVDMDIVRRGTVLSVEQLSLIRPFSRQDVK